MSQFDKYKVKKASEFSHLVGVNYGTFQILLEKLKKSLLAYRAEKTDKTTR